MKTSHGSYGHFGCGGLWFYYNKKTISSKTDFSKKYEVLEKMCRGLNGVAMRATDAKPPGIWIVFRCGSNGAPHGPPKTKNTMKKSDLGFRIFVYMGP